MRELHVRKCFTESPLSADLWLLNSCTVKGPSEDGLKNSIRKGRELGKPLVITGCVPQGQRNHTDIEGLSVVGVSYQLHTHSTVQCTCTLTNMHAMIVLYNVMHTVCTHWKTYMYNMCSSCFSAFR